MHEGQRTLATQRRAGRCLWGLGLATVLAGCQPAAETTAPEATTTTTGATTPSGPAGPLTGRQILERMVAVYRQASTYADEGVLRHKMQLGDQRVDEAAEFSVSFERPNRVRMQVYQAGVVCDGQKLHATLAELTGQVLEVDAPAALTLESLHADPVLASVLAGGMAGGPPALAMLLSDQALQAFLAQGGEPVLLESASFDERPCFRVQLLRPDGMLVVWVDQQDFVLRRIDYPTEALRRHYANQGEVRELELWAEFPGATLNQPIDPLAWQFAAPPEARVVKRLVMVPQPPPPSPLLGKPIGEFTFTDLSGSPVDKAALAGKVVVLDFWATWCQPCMQSLPNLNQVYLRYRDNPRVAILAVSIDLPAVDNARVNEAFARAGLGIPIVRDTSEQARTAFGIQGIPNLFILGPDGTVEDNEIGFNPQLASELPERIEQLLAGKSLVAQAQARHADRMADYERQFAEQERAALAQDAAPVRVDIAPASQPTKLRLTKLWSYTGLKRAGNLLAIERDGELERVCVIDGFKQVVELSPQGEKLREVAWDIPKTSVVSYLRTGVEPGGRRLFLGSAGNQQFLHLFDQDWRPLLAYPEGEAAELMDADLVDLDGDGRLEIVAGYWGVVGVQGVSQDGERLWQNRSLENVFRVAVVGQGSDQPPRLLCTHARGTLQPIGPGGEDQPELVVPNRFIRTLVAADLDGNGREEYCGLAITNSSQEDALGIAADGSELWAYTLPEGVHEEPIESIAAGQLWAEGSGQWLLAAADGSLHLLSAEGQLIDRFHYGKRLAGLAITQLGGKPTLIVATNEGVDAWSVE